MLSVFIFNKKRLKSFKKNVTIVLKLNGNYILFSYTLVSQPTNLKLYMLVAPIRTRAKHSFGSLRDVLK